MQESRRPRGYRYLLSRRYRHTIDRIHQTVALSITRNEMTAHSRKAKRRSRPVEQVLAEIVSTFRSTGLATSRQAKFRYASAPNKAHSIAVMRGNGNCVPIRHADVVRAIHAVRSDPSIYSRGPSSLREFNITHINSPVWALLRLLPLHKIVR